MHGVKTAMPCTCTCMSTKVAGAQAQHCYSWENPQPLVIIDNLG